MAPTPRLPFYQSQRPLPATSGTPAGVQQVPTVQQSGVGDAGPTALEQSLGAFPRAVQQTGVAMTQVESLRLQTDALKSQQQKAQDVLDAKTTLQEYRQSLQARYSALQEGDYKELAPKTLEEGKFLIAEFGRTLTPQARALFTEDAEETLSTIQQHALGEYGRRRDQHASYTLTREVQQFQEAYTQATNPYERQVVLGQFDGFLERSAATGLFQGATLADIRKKTMDSVALQGIQTAIQTDPEGMVTQLLAQARGEPTREDLPVAPLEHLAQLTAQARDVRRQQWSEREHQERWQDYQLKQQQDKNSVALRTSLYTTPLTRENVRTFDTLVHQAAEMMKKGELDETTGEHLMQVAQAHGQQAAKPPVEQDDPMIERTVALLVMQAQTPTELAAARQVLTQAGRQALTPDTFTKYAEKLETREKATFWHNLPEVQAAREILVRGAVIPYGGSFAGQMKPKMQQKLTLALDTWEYALQQRLDDPRQGLDAVRREARTLAEEMRQRYLQPDFEDQSDVQEYLPTDVQNARTPGELAQIIHKMHQQGVPPWQLNIMRENWHRWQGSPGWPSRRAPGTPPPPPLSGAPASPGPAPATPYRTN